MATGTARRQRVAHMAVASLIMLAEATRANVCGQHVERFDSSLEYGQPDTSRLGRGYGFTRFDRVVVINLERRADRLSNFTRAMSSLGVSNFTVVTGIEHRACGLLGSALGHAMAVQECAAGGGAAMCLIAEDDFAVTQGPQAANAAVERFFVEAWPGDTWHGKAWDVLLLGHNLLLWSDMHADDVVRVIKALVSSAYVVTRPYAPTLAAAFWGAAAKLNSECAVYHAVDAAWLPLQSRDAWYALRPPVVHQMPSFSDIQGRFTDYGGGR